MSQPLGRENDWERVKNATDIVRLVGEHVKLKAKGREYVGLCPFHDDHSPSMYVIPAKQIFHCFVCGAGGDCYSFAGRLFRMERHEALKHLAERANIELTPWKPTRASGDDSAPAGPSRADLLAASAFASDFFRALLRHPEHGESGRAVIARRGISPEMVEQFGIGVTANRWDGLLMMLRSKGLREQAFVEAGLLKRRESGDGAYDSFRNRLMFPIHDIAGRVIAFGGRKIDEQDEPKYINSPETRLFNKSQTLYGLFQASREISRLGEAVITEGYTDTIACHQAGVTNVVATLGTALTREHAAMLSRHCSRVVLLFDGDAAGQKAADRAIEVFFAEPIDVAICALSDHTDAKDPDELLKRPGGRETLRQAFAASTDLLTYRFGRLRTRLEGAGVSALSKAIHEEIQALKELGLAEVEPIKRRLVVKLLSKLAGLDEPAIWDAIGGESAPRRAARVIRPREDQDEATDRDTEISEELRRLTSGRISPRETLIGCLLADGDLIHNIPHEQRDLIAPAAYPSALVAKVAEAISLTCERKLPPILHAVLDELSGEDAGEMPASAATTLCRRIETETQADASRLRQYFDKCLQLTMTEDGVSDAAPGIFQSQPAAALDPAARLEQIRRDHTTTGGDRRRLPGSIRRRLDS